MLFWLCDCSKDYDETNNQTFLPCNVLLWCDEDFEDAADVLQTCNKQTQSDNIDHQKHSMLEQFQRDMQVIKNSSDTYIPQVISQKLIVIVELDRNALLIACHYVDWAHTWWHQECIDVLHAYEVIEMECLTTATTIKNQNSYKQPPDYIDHKIIDK